MNDMFVKYKKYILGGALGLVAIIIVVGLFLKGSIFGGGRQEVSTDDPVNIVVNFYEPWLAAFGTTSTTILHSELAKTPILSKKLRERLSDLVANPQGEVDPVLCQVEVPPGLATRSVYEGEDSAQVLVMSTDRESFEQAVVTLIRHNEGWYIDEIVCSAGEFAPEREFSFEREGFLLKSVNPPLDPQYWHLVYEENNQQGHVAPLFFSAGSLCVSLDGDESVCSPDQLMETSKAVVRGELTELGVQVKRLELIRE